MLPLLTLTGPLCNDKYMSEFKGDTPNFNHIKNGDDPASRIQLGGKNDGEGLRLEMPLDMANKSGGESSGLMLEFPLEHQLDSGDGEEKQDPDGDHARPDTHHDNRRINFGEKIRIDSPESKPERDSRDKMLGEAGIYAKGKLGEDPRFERLFTHGDGKPFTPDQLRGAVALLDNLQQTPPSETPDKSDK